MFIWTSYKEVLFVFLSSSSARDNYQYDTNHRHSKPSCEDHFVTIQTWERIQHFPGKKRAERFRQVSNLRPSLILIEVYHNISIL